MLLELVCPTCGVVFTKSSYQIRKGQKRVFCSHACHSKANVKQRLNASGYRIITVDGKQVYEHRHIMSLHLGRSLNRKEHVHHINGDKADNRIENLELISESDHHREHVKPAFDVDTAHALYVSGVGYRKLSEIFGVARQNIRACFVSRGWHIEGRGTKKGQ